VAQALPQRQQLPQIRLPALVPRPVINLSISSKLLLKPANNAVPLEVAVEEQQEWEDLALWVPIWEQEPVREAKALARPSSS
jgi:hypothetical protein